MAQTLYDKLFDSHIVSQEAETATLYIDRHLMHEVTSAQAFEGLRLAQRKPWRILSVVATVDHNTPTHGFEKGLAAVTDPVAYLQVKTLDENIRREGSAAYFPYGTPRQGIIHVVGPEEGASLPGMTIVCGDSHTSTHGALATLAFGIGTSEVEHVLATQTFVTKKNTNMRVTVTGHLEPGVTAKDLALAIIGKIGTAGGTGATIEFDGTAIHDLSIEGRMTLCNMAIEAGARSGIVAVDEKTIEYLKGRPLAPRGECWDKAVEYWKTLVSDPDAHFDKEVTMDASEVAPMVSWGTSPEMVLPVTEEVPNPASEKDPVRRAWFERAQAYIRVRPGQKLTEIYPDRVFIGSCTNGRIEDIRSAAYVLEALAKRGYETLAKTVSSAWVVPGSGLVKIQAEKEGLDLVFKKAGFDWREPGCSMCLAMNEDKLKAGERCASTTNRNFESRQGKGGITHIVSPAMAAAAAVVGHFIDIRELFNGD